MYVLYHTLAADDSSMYRCHDHKTANCENRLQEPQPQNRHVGVFICAEDWPLIMPVCGEMRTFAPYERLSNSGAYQRNKKKKTILFFFPAFSTGG